jgi:hypothetical protein
MGARTHSELNAEGTPPMATPKSTICLWYNRDAEAAARRV